MPSWDGMRKKTIAGRVGAAQRGFRQARPTTFRRQLTDVGAERRDGPGHVAQARPHGEHGAGLDEPRSDPPVRVPDETDAAKPIATDPAPALAPPLEGKRLSPEPDPSALRSEIVAFTDRLAEHGISVNELVALTPRRAGDLRSALAAGRIVAEEPDLGRHLSTQHALPLAVMHARTGLSRQILERRQKYIIAIALMMRPEFPGLRRYLSEAGV